VVPGGGEDLHAWTERTAVVLAGAHEERVSARAAHAEGHDHHPVACVDGEVGHDRSSRLGGLEEHPGRGPRLALVDGALVEHSVVHGPGPDTRMDEVEDTPGCGQLVHRVEPRGRRAGDAMELRPVGTEDGRRKQQQGHECNRETDERRTTADPAMNGHHRAILGVARAQRYGHAVLRSHVTFGAVRGGLMGSGVRWCGSGWSGAGGVLCGPVRSGAFQSRACTTPTAPSATASSPTTTIQPVTGRSGLPKPTAPPSARPSRQAVPAASWPTPRGRVVGWAAGRGQDARRAPRARRLP